MLSFPPLPLTTLNFQFLIEEHLKMRTIAQTADLPENSTIRVRPPPQVKRECYPQLQMTRIIFKLMIFRVSIRPSPETQPKECLPKNCSQLKRPEQPRKSHDLPWWSILWDLFSFPEENLIFFLNPVKWQIPDSVFVCWVWFWLFLFYWKFIKLGWCQLWLLDYAVEFVWRFVMDFVWNVLFWNGVIGV